MACKVRAHARRSIVGSKTNRFGTRYYYLVEFSRQLTIFVFLLIALEMEKREDIFVTVNSSEINNNNVTSKLPYRFTELNGVRINKN